MKNCVLLLIALCLTSGARAATPLESAALDILSGGSAQFINLSGGADAEATTDPAISLADVRAITNGAAVLALAAERENTPTPILPSLAVADGGEVIIGRWRYSPDPDTGQLIAVGPVHGSPWITKAQRDSLVKAGAATNAALRAEARLHHGNAKAANSTANNVPAMRAMMVEQQAAIDAIMQMLGIEK